LEDYSREKVDLISQDFRSVISEKEDKGSKGDVTRTTTTCYISIRGELAVDIFQTSKKNTIENLTGRN